MIKTKLYILIFLIIIYIFYKFSNSNKSKSNNILDNYDKLKPIELIDFELDKRSFTERDDVTKMVNLNDYMDKGLSHEQISDLVALKLKLSKFKKIYNQHNHAQWSPHTHIGKYLIDDHMEKKGFDYI